MAPKKVSILEPPKGQVELNENLLPLAESPAEIVARTAPDRAAEQKELDNAWKMIPHVDQRKLRAGNYCGYDLDMLLKPWYHGNHPHDFYKASRSSRSDDLAKHYEFGELLKRHDARIFELEGWRKRELLKDDMRGQLRKMDAVQVERLRYQKLRKQIRAEQLQFQNTPQLPLSPHIIRFKLNSEEEEEEEHTEGEATEGLPSSTSLEDIDGVVPSSGLESGEGAATPKRKKQAAPRMRYSLFHYDTPWHLKRYPKAPTHTTEKEPEYSPIQHVHNPAWIKGKAQHISELVQLVESLDEWEEKLARRSGPRQSVKTKKSK